MFKKMKHIKNEKGLTLIELLAVIVILAIIAAIAIPAIGNIITNQRDKAVLAEISGVISAAKIAHVDGTCVDDKCSKDELKDYVSAKGFGATGNEVDLSDPTDPVITYTLGADETIKGSKIYTQLSAANNTTMYETAIPATTGVIKIAESKLNKIMGK